MKALDDKKIPLIFLHKGSPLYLQIALRKAKSVCSSDVYLIGDETNNYSYIKHAFIKDYNHNDLKNIISICRQMVIIMRYFVCNVGLF